MNKPNCKIKEGNFNFYNGKFDEEKLYFFTIFVHEYQRQVKSEHKNGHV